MTTPDSTRRAPRRKAEKSPAFQLYTKDLLSDANVLAMTLTEFGAYVKLFAICWNESGLPNDDARLARMLGISATEFAPIWAEISRCFYLAEDKWQHSRLDEERRKQAKFRRQHTLAARARWDKRQSGRNADALRDTSAASPPQSSSSASSSSSAFASSEGKREPVRSRVGSGVMAGTLPRDHINCRQPCIRVCVSERLHAVLRERHGGTDADLDAFYADVRGNLHGPVAQRPWQFWEDQFNARFGGSQPSSKTAGNIAAAARFVARGQK